MNYFSPVKIGLFCLALASIFWIAGSFPGEGACAIQYRLSEVNGFSLAGLIDSGSRVRIAYGYYACSDLQRDDLVIYKDAGSVHPLIKIVKGIPGDSFILARAEGGSKVVLNERILLTSTGEPYLVRDEAERLLALYERDYDRRIPDGAVFVLGNVSSGSRDSTQFGFGSVQNLLGKVVEVLPAQ